jgi:hypothetical protein
VPLYRNFITDPQTFTVVTAATDFSVSLNPIAQDICLLFIMSAIEPKVLSLTIEKVSSVYPHRHLVYPK